MGMSGKRDPNISWSPTDVDALDLSGKRVVVVGGTGGLGRALARAMAGRGAEVTVVGRTFRDDDATRVEFVRADLSSMAEARRIGREIAGESLDLLLFTSGIMAAPRREQTTEGLEKDLAVSYLSRLAIAREVGPKMRPKGRIFVMGFPGTGAAGDPDDLDSERAYSPMTAHGNTVAGNEALVLDAARRWPHLGVFGLNPGLVKTNIRGNYLGEGSLRHRIIEWLIGLLTMSPETYARRVVPLLFSPDLDGVTGAHFDNKPLAISSSDAMTEAHVERIIAASERLLAPRAGDVSQLRYIAARTASSTRSRPSSPLMCTILPSRPITMCSGNTWFGTR